MRAVKRRSLPRLGFPTFVALVVPGLFLVARSTEPSDLSAGVLLMLVGTACLRPSRSRS